MCSYFLLKQSTAFEFFSNGLTRSKCTAPASSERETTELNNTTLSTTAEQVTIEDAAPSFVGKVLIVRDPFLKCLVQQHIFVVQLLLDVELKTALSTNKSQPKGITGLFYDCGGWCPQSTLHHTALFHTWTILVCRSRCVPDCKRAVLYATEHRDSCV